MARDAMKDEPLAPTMIAAWTFQALFLVALVWDLASGQVHALSDPDGHESSVLTAVSGRTIVGSACEPPASASDGPRCGAAAWTLP